jgi:hypothetical protein
MQVLNPELPCITDFPAGSRCGWPSQRVALCHAGRGPRFLHRSWADNYVCAQEETLRHPSLDEHRRLAVSTSRQEDFVAGRKVCLGVSPPRHTQKLHLDYGSTVSFRVCLAVV